MKKHVPQNHGLMQRIISTERVSEPRLEQIVALECGHEFMGSWTTLFPLGELSRCHKCLSPNADPSSEYFTGEKPQVLEPIDR
jgi:hypothetical protein